MRINKNKELGISILEALMATVIVGVGFVAVFQMVNYSINSIDVSGERTKANYLVSMLAEDVIGHRNSLYGVDAADEGITINEFGEPVKKDDTGAEVSYKKFTDHLIENPYKINTCAGKTASHNLHAMHLSSPFGYLLRACSPLMRGLIDPFSNG